MAASISRCVIKPLAVSKANTVAQIVLAATVLADEAFASGSHTVASGAGVDYGSIDPAFAGRLSQGLVHAHDWIRVRQGRVGADQPGSAAEHEFVRQGAGERT